jgi:cyclase
MDRDGTGEGYDVALLRAVSETTDVPLVASGGAGEPAHFAEAILEGHADAVLGASRFHFEELSIRRVKEYLAGRRIPVRL